MQRLLAFLVRGALRVFDFLRECDQVVDWPDAIGDARGDRRGRRLRTRNVPLEGSGSGATSRFASSFGSVGRLPERSGMGRRAPPPPTKRAYPRIMRQHFVSHWRVWLVIAVVVIVANELIDRNFFDHQEHIDGDVVITVLVLLIAVLGSYFVARFREPRAPG